MAAIITIRELVRACEKKNLSDVRQALDAGVNVNERDPGDGWTPLCTAAAFADLDLVAFLLANGALANGKSSSGETALFQAARRGNVEMVRLLIEHGADVNAHDSEGRVPLNPALTNRESDDHMEVIELLLSNGADVAGNPLSGRTPLHQAASNNNVRGARLLLDHGADVNARAEDGRTPLQVHEDEERGVEGRAMDDLLDGAGGKGW